MVGFRCLKLVLQKVTVIENLAFLKGLLGIIFSRLLKHIHVFATS